VQPATIGLCTKQHLGDRISPETLLLDVERKKFLGFSWGRKHITVFSTSSNFFSNLCQMIQANIYTKFYVRVILLSTASYSTWLFSFTFQNQHFKATHFSAMRATLTDFLFLLDFIILLIFADEYKSCNFSVYSYSFRLSLVASPLLGPNFFLRNAFSHTLNLCHSLHVRHHVSQPNKTTVKIKILGLKTDS